MSVAKRTEEFVRKYFKETRKVYLVKCELFSELSSELL